MAANVFLSRLWMTPVIWQGAWGRGVTAVINQNVCSNTRANQTSNTFLIGPEWVSNNCTCLVPKKITVSYSPLCGKGREQVRMCTTKWGFVEGSVGQEVNKIKTEAASRPPAYSNRLTSSTLLQYSQWFTPGFVLRPPWEGGPACLPSTYSLSDYLSICSHRRL